LILLIDIGNTRIKWAEWGAGGLVHIRAAAYRMDKLSEQFDDLFGGCRDLSRVLIASVADQPFNEALARWFRQQYSIEVAFAESQARHSGLISAYQQPQRLGVDRWLMMLALYRRMAGAFCVISCGSAITLDLVAADGRHQGGLIMPGLGMMQQALATRTAAITEVPGQLVDLADNTEDAVYSGCLQLAAQGLSGLVVDYRERFADTLPCVISGGDGERIAERMKVACDYEADLVLKGLGTLLED
jgi:type III pantothenate kinase